jgi:hypothetical protein
MLHDKEPNLRMIISDELESCKRKRSRSICRYSLEIQQEIIKNFTQQNEYIPRDRFEQDTSRTEVGCLVADLITSMMLTSWSVFLLNNVPCGTSTNVSGSSDTSRKMGNCSFIDVMNKTRRPRPASFR